MFRILSIVLFGISSAFADSPNPEPLVIEGKTMGTTYRIVYFDEPQRRDYKASVDSLLAVVNRSINTYDPASEISRFNTSEKGVRLDLPYLYEILRYAKKVNKASGGAFDPTVMPLVNAWGFGPAKSGEPNDHQVDSLKSIVGFSKVRFTKKRVRKSVPHVQLDMGGIGQGFGADVVFRFLRSKGIKDVLVELGGEGVAAGKNLKKGQDWTIGILHPHSTLENQYFKAYVVLRNQAFTTSGNYFNYKIIDGRKYGHTIDPATGRPVQHSLLSASVFAEDCTTADAWATALMVMGTETAIEKVGKVKGIDVILFYSDEAGEVRHFITSGIRNQTILE